MRYLAYDLLSPAKDGPLLRDSEVSVGWEVYSAGRLHGVRAEVVRRGAAWMPVGETARNPVATGRVGSKVTAGDRKQHRAYRGAMRKLILAFALLGCENAPDPADQDIVVKDETVARLSRQLGQQDNVDDARRAFRLLVQAGQKGIDVIMALDSAGAMNERVWRGVRRGSRLTDEVCPQLPEFTACVQNACRRKLGITGHGTFQFSCRDLPRIRGAFRPEELEGFAAQCGADTLATPFGDERQGGVCP